MLENKKLSDITEADIRGLLENSVREGKAIEYKRELHGNSDGERKEFLADVSSFANTSGGHIIFGVEESEGIPVSFPGLPAVDCDAEILRLETAAQNGIEPRIPGLASHPVQMEDSPPVIVMRIPKSWASPHMISYQNYSRFYARNSAGKYPLDVNEIRTAFFATEAISNKINSFRLDRISKIISGETPIPLKDGGKLIDMTRISSANKLIPIRCPTTAGYNSKHNLDGFVNYSTYRDAYTLLFRNGSVEAVNTDFMTPEDRPVVGRMLTLYPGQVEEEIIERVSDYLDYQKSNGIDAPLVIMLAFSGAKNYRLMSSDRFSVGHPIDRDILILPEVILENFDFDVGIILKPIFDAMWNAAGIAKSPFYDETGKRKPK